MVGGFGTRLRPLTLSRPKPLVEFINRPILEHQIEALVRVRGALGASVQVGVTEVVLAVNYRPETMIEAIRELEAKVRRCGCVGAEGGRVAARSTPQYPIKVVCSQETEPLGTGAWRAVG